MIPSRSLLRAVSILCVLVAVAPAARAGGIALVDAVAGGRDVFRITGAEGTAAIIVDPADYEVVHVAAGLLADDVERVAGRRPEVAKAAPGAGEAIIVGTLGHSGVIQSLVDAGRLRGLDEVRGRWEATLVQVVDAPFPGVRRALVIVGSDRRGAAYGLMQLSQAIGVSPWVWWADVPARRRDSLAVRIDGPQVDAPAVQYRGIFINDEDWGLFPWASKTFDPEYGNIGPRTYAKVFELMLRLRLNYIWPAMHACSQEFAADPRNAALADKYGIVAGASHCEPMLCNNVHWDEKTQGPWNYSTNRDTIHDYWEQAVKSRGQYEGVWGLGIRGIHDRGMESPPSSLPERLDLLTQIFHDQRELLDAHVTHKWGPIAQAFVPYKEVLPIYDAGLPVPGDVTIVWVDDNFGYIRRLGNPHERTRPGGAGVYWHLSYYGGPHSYTWINTDAPALMWEELHKAWENDARRIWVINVGDIKPAEIGIDYFSRLAWDPEAHPLGRQAEFLQGFAARTFGPGAAPAIARLLGDFYRLGTVRKPELMERRWALSLTPERARALHTEYRELMARANALSSTVPEAARDAYTELVGFPIHVLGETGLIFLADRAVQLGQDADANAREIARLRNDLEARVNHFNTQVAAGKWNRMMPGLVTGEHLMAWSSQVRWPWGEKPDAPLPDTAPQPAEAGWRDATTADRRTAAGTARWADVQGLGPTGKAAVLLPSGLNFDWGAPGADVSLEYDFTADGTTRDAWIDFLPAFRLYPGMKLRVAASLDNGDPIAVEVPGSSGNENENGQIRSQAVQDAYVRAHVALPSLTAGRHTFRITAMDPGAVIERVWLPAK